MPEKAAFFHFYSAFCFIPREISGLIPSRPETRQIPSGFRDPPARAASFNQKTLFITTRSGSLCEKEVEDLAHHGLSLLFVAAEF
jgi:hypothetical protein